VKKDFREFIKTFLVEIISFFVSILILLQLLYTDFSRNLITGFDYFRPEYAFMLLVIFTLLTAIVFLLFILQVRKKKLKSTKVTTIFSKTVERSHIIREMSKTQVVYSAETGAVNEMLNMPPDIDSTNPNVVELYFNYEVKLNI
jgi:hypothetical protein